MLAFWKIVCPVGAKHSALIKTCKNTLVLLNCQHWLMNKICSHTYSRSEKRQPMQLRGPPEKDIKLENIPGIEATVGPGPEPSHLSGLKGYVLVLPIELTIPMTTY